MKKTALRFALVALPALFAASCGIDNLLGTLDGGTGGACPTGTTIYRVADNTYPAVTGSAQINSDTCNTGISASQLETMRRVKNDANGNITVYSADGSTIIGTGPVRCNTGTLTYGPTQITDGVCRFNAEYSVSFTATADNAFTVQVTQTRTNSMSEAGQTCTQPQQSCAVSYRVSQKL